MLPGLMGAQANGPDPRGILLRTAAAVAASWPRATISGATWSAAEIMPDEAEVEIRPGDWVVLATLPPWVSKLPPDTRQVFDFCLGRRYRVEGIVGGHLVLDVSPDIDARFGGFRNDIRVEPFYVTLSQRP